MDAVVDRWLFYFTAIVAIVARVVDWDVWVDLVFLLLFRGVASSDGLENVEFLIFKGVNFNVPVATVPFNSVAASNTSRFPFKGLLWLFLGIYRLLLRLFLLRGRDFVG